jgi:propane monooxygenase reductase subunit
MPAALAAGIASMRTNCASHKRIAMAEVHRVKLEPVDIEIDVARGETVLDAAFRQGITLAHGCKEGQCAACKAFVIDGEVDLAKYSNFALSDAEREDGYTLLCKTHIYEDTTIELLHFDEDLIRSGIPIRTFTTHVAEIAELTHDIRRLRLDLADPVPFTFHAGQYVDVHVPHSNQKRAYSMANTPSQSDRVELIIRLYPGGHFSELLSGSLKVGDPVEVTGPFGTCTLREKSERDIIMIGGGAGMAPLWSLANALAERKSERNVAFYYGARAARDLFYLDEMAGLKDRLPHFHSTVALSELAPGDRYSGETGFITDVVDRLEPDLSEHEAYVCGPPPMVDAATELLERRGLPADRIYVDKFTITAAADEGAVLQS